MRRRALLSAGGAALGSALAGCLDGADGEHRGDGPTDAAADVSLSLGGERVQPGVLVVATGSIGVRSNAAQYLFVDVAVTDGRPPSRSELGFRYGGDVFSPLLDVGSAASLYRAAETDDPRYGAPRREGWLLFELPRERSASHAALVSGDREWPIAGATRERLSRASPPLTVDWGLAGDQPARAAGLTFTVTNEGDVGTRFVAGLTGPLAGGARGPVAGFNREIPAGETVSWTATHDGGDPSVPSTEAAADSHYHLEWSGGEDDRYAAHARDE